ncbi:anti-sigma factor family protein [Streptomyces yaizuensis]|uniref:Zf-HC2 domain-containing protein n=1 Tax=Streptomyces yaizuensis TaxID=2989713 RepID=A0ABQ5NVU5_9ACTN|nr:zf-HC2 domain-containing protein [Streptomyces sp. YSPA8]GLF94484.1 zf-HC2 domain-containing protein [Streptomyces sp. YSPA8]
MSGIGPTPAEQHLGDRLAALIDGELKHDARDRVLAHLATCARCKAEADAQRRLKDVFAQAAPPPPSEGLLARLQGLPGVGPGADGGPGGPFGPGSVVDIFAGSPGVAAVSGRPTGRPDFGYVPGGHAGSPALPGRSGGFRIHEMGRPDAERSLPAWRGRRFAFAAASAVSFAAIALGGALPLDGTAQTTARGGGQGNSVTPLRATGGTSGPAGAVGGGLAGSGAPAATPGARSLEYDRRRSFGGVAPVRSEGRDIGRSVPGLFGPAVPAASAAPAAPAGPLLRPPSLLEPLAALPVLPSVVAPPLIRPPGAGLRLAAVPVATPSVTPAPSHLVAPSEPTSALNRHG